jgi:hypothetical protein
MPSKEALGVADRILKGCVIHDPDGTWLDVQKAGVIIDRAVSEGRAELLASCEACLSIVADAIMHGMPITKSVAAARNNAVTAIAKARGTTLGHYGGAYCPEPDFELSQQTPGGA